MGQSYRYCGEVKVKAGTTFEQLRALWPDEPADAAASEIAVEDCGTVSLVGDTVYYEIDGYNSHSFYDRMEAFLDTLASDFATEGWVSFEGESEDEAFYGPTPIAAADAEVAYRQGAVTNAQKALASALARRKNLG